MYYVTKSSIKDSDIDFGRIRKRLEEIAQEIKNSNKRNLTDINIICEEIFGEILNAVYDLKLIAVSSEISGNFVAVDLIDYDQKIAFQVTSRSDRGKIKDTIDKFNRSELKEQIHSLYFLILSMEPHKYKETMEIELSNGSSFSFANHILFLSDLLTAIEQKAEQQTGFLAEVYDRISMVFDSGRLRYFNVVKETELLSGSEQIGSDDWSVWEKGYGDTKIKAFIPQAYDQELSCLLLLRQHDLNGAYITFDQETLRRDYFLTEKEFEARHYVGRYEHEDTMYIQMENLRMQVNAHTAHHIYELFSALREEYGRALEHMEQVLGTGGLPRKGKKILLSTITRKEWSELLLFAREHDWSLNNEENEWNIFNNNSNLHQLILSPNMHSRAIGDILAVLSAAISKADDNRMEIFWEPGFCWNMDTMEGFDNITKWKADYTKEWLEKKLLKRASEFEREQRRTWTFRGWFWKKAK